MPYAPATPTVRIPSFRAHSLRVLTRFSYGAWHFPMSCRPGESLTYLEASDLYHAFRAATHIMSPNFHLLPQLEEAEERGLFTMTEVVSEDGTEALAYPRYDRFIVTVRRRRYVPGMLQRLQTLVGSEMPTAEVLLNFVQD